MRAAGIDNPRVAMEGGPRGTLDNQNEQSYPFHQVIKNKSKHGLFLEEHHPTLIIPTVHSSSFAWSLATRGSELPGVISCQTLHLNISHPAQFKVQVSPYY